jgi:NTP pyrophosphatase (non-canonical NTP hydrolase)
MKKQYMPITDLQKLGYLVEECGEVMAAVGKTIRWGLDSSNPELPEQERETNRDWILRELKDLKDAIKITEEELERDI